MAVMFRQFLFPLAAGLFVFLAGMKIMECALGAWTGGRMKTMLARLTRTPLLGLLTGTVATAALQSSSAVTVLTVGMVNAGVLTFPQTLGIVLGANIGTCLTTELVGLQLTGGAFPALVVCLAAHLLARMPFSPLRRAPAAAAAVSGLSLAAAGFCGIMLGIRIMQGIVPFLRENGLFAWFLDHAGRSPLWGIAAGAVLAAVIHSSSATIAMAMGLSALGVLPVPVAIAVVLGSNAGTCLTALLAGIGGGRYGLFVAVSHTVLNVAGVVLFYPFIAPLHALSAMITQDPAGQIAHAQTLFNVICSLLALPVCYLPVFRHLAPSGSAAGRDPNGRPDEGAGRGAAGQPGVAGASGHGLAGAARPPVSPAAGVRLSIRPRVGPRAADGCGQSAGEAGGENRRAAGSPERY